MLFLQKVRQILSINNVTAVATLTLVVISAVVAGTLFWSTTQLERATTAVIRDSQNRATATGLELELLTYQRLSSLYAITGSNDLIPDRTGLNATLEDLLSDAASSSASAREVELREQVAAQIAAYLALRTRAEISDLSPADLIDVGRPEFDDLLQTLRVLRDLNDLQVANAHAQALRVDEIAKWLAFGGVWLILLVLVAIMFGIDGYVRRPLLELHQTIAKFRQGDRDVRAQSRGVREIREVGESFNEMADTLARQQNDQLTSIAGIAHDLRSPLHALRISVDTLVNGGNQRQRVQVHQLIVRQVEYLRRITGDLLTAVQIESGHLSLVRENVDLCTIVEDVVNLYAPTAAAHSIVVRFAQKPVVINADPLRIEQVVSNLLGNAIKYSPNGGRISVAVETDDESAELSITDEGVGIAAGDLRDLFMAFRRTNVNIAPGAGLGLSVVRWIVNAHGAVINVHSEVDVGSTFRVVFPLQSSAADTGSDIREVAAQ